MVHLLWKRTGREDESAKIIKVLRRILPTERKIATFEVDEGSLEYLAHGERWQPKADIEAHNVDGMTVILKYFAGSSHNEAMVEVIIGGPNASEVEALARKIRTASGDLLKEQ
jgi:hypothetical protein